MTEHQVTDDQLPQIAGPELAILGVASVFRFADGHPAQYANCAVCGLLIGSLPVVVLGLAALAGDVCPRGCVFASGYLMHETCQASTDDELHDRLQSALACNEHHPWE